MLLYFSVWSQAGPLRFNGTTADENPLSDDAIRSAVMAPIVKRRNASAPLLPAPSKPLSKTDQEELDVIFHGIIAEMNGSVTVDFSQLAELIADAEKQWVIDHPNETAKAQTAIDQLNKVGWHSFKFN